MKKLLVVLVCVVTGCGTPIVKSSTPRSVTIDSPPHLSAEAHQLAEKECQAHGKHAQLNSNTNARTSVFNCVD